jgi:hypothetical protein
MREISIALMVIAEFSVCLLLIFNGFPIFGGILLFFALESMSSYAKWINGPGGSE